MAAIRFSKLKSLCSTINPSSRKQLFRPCGCAGKIGQFADQIDVRPSITCINRNYHSKEGFTRNRLGTMGLESLAGTKRNRTNFVAAFLPTLSNLCLRRCVCPIAINPMLSNRLYSSFVDSKGDKARDAEVAAASGAGDGEPVVSDSGAGGNDLLHMAKDAWRSTVDAVTYTGERAKEATTELTPHVQEFLDSHLYLKDVIVPVGVTTLAWVVLPRLLRRLHQYSTQGPATLLSGSTLWGPVPYEKSFWGALEVPLRYLVTFMAFSQIGMMVAPTTIASQYIGPAWRGAFVVSLVWFLHRWKTNVLHRALAARNIAGVEREKLVTLDRISSVGLFVLGLMGLAEACGVAVQSILTVGGIGGVATAFAARDILGNILSGLSVQISQPFSVGETIKAGSVEGQVVEMGITTTLLLSVEKFPIMVPNSLFSSQVIVNKSRAPSRAMVSKIPLQTDDFSKIPQITGDIKSMLRSNPKVFLEMEPPYCYLSRIERSYAELTLGCNLIRMGKEELFSTQQDILLQSVQIIKQHGATLGCSLEDMISQ